MNGIKSISTIINRKSIKCIYLKKQLVHVSLRYFKEIKSPTVAAVTGTEEVIKLKKNSELSRPNWFDTDLALFGPIIKTKKNKKEKTTKSIENPKASANGGVPVSATEKKRRTKSTKPLSISDADVTTQTADLRPIKLHESHIIKKGIVETSEQQENREQTQAALTALANPFFQRDDVILPFPMVLNKQLEPESQAASKEIFTISSTEKKMPSVTQILNLTMSENSMMMLALWRKRKIAEVGEEGFQEFMKEAKLTGKTLHNCIETTLRGVDYSKVHVEPRISGHWLSLKSALYSLEKVLVLESYVAHPQLNYKGFVDCVAQHEGNLVVIEWKTSQRRKSSLKEAYDDPIQLAAYIGALNADQMYPFEVENALLVVCYPTGMPADVIKLNRNQCEHYWYEWLKRLEAFNHLKAAITKQ